MAFRFSSERKKNGSLRPDTVLISFIPLGQENIWDSLTRLLADS
ncbi:MAG: hypothetical protein ACI9FU_002094, partial [Granulosicoccus sp.]